jgi:hypothetical protein
MATTVDRHAHQLFSVAFERFLISDDSLQQMGPPSHHDGLNAKKLLRRERHDADIPVRGTTNQFDFKRRSSHRHSESPLGSFSPLLPLVELRYRQVIGTEPLTGVTNPLDVGGTRFPMGPPPRSFVVAPRCLKQAAYAANFLCRRILSSFE